MNCNEQQGIVVPSYLILSPPNIPTHSSPSQNISCTVWLESWSYSAQAENPSALHRLFPEAKAMNWYPTVALLLATEQSTGRE